MVRLLRSYGRFIPWDGSQSNALLTTAEDASHACPRHEAPRGLVRRHRKQRLIAASRAPVLAGGRCL